MHIHKAVFVHPNLLQDLDEFADSLRRISREEPPATTMATACAQLSQYTYKIGTPYEFEERARISYSIVRAWDRDYIREDVDVIMGAAADKDYQLVIILTDDLLIVSVLVNSLLIIAFRGTRVETFKDWLRNLDLVQVSEKSISYHRGWFKLLVAHGRMLLDHVHKVRLGVSGLHVCVTGHSMGGAVAGILQSLCLSLKTKSSREQLAKLQEIAISGFDKDDYRRMVNLMNHLRVPDAYTFGAPMFAFARNEEGEKYLAKAFHFRFPGDIVCALPTRLLGYQFYGTSLDECALPQDFASLSDIIDQQHTIRRYYETLKAL